MRRPRKQCLLSRARRASALTTTRCRPGAGGGGNPPGGVPGDPTGRRRARVCGMRIPGWPLWISVLQAVGCQTGCQGKADRESPPAAAISAEKSVGSPTDSPYAVPERTDQALQQALALACERAHSAAKPVLLEFSAPWCSDCRRLAKMKASPTLARALDEYEAIVVNVGEFDQHGWLFEPFEVRAIARWEVLGTANCVAPADRWPRFGGRTLEPTQKETKLTPSSLAKWLDERRAKALAQL